MSFMKGYNPKALLKESGFPCSLFRSAIIACLGSVVGLRFSTWADVCRRNVLLNEGQLRYQAIVELNGW